MSLTLTEHFRKVINDVAPILLIEFGSLKTQKHASEQNYIVLYADVPTVQAHVNNIYKHQYFKNEPLKTENCIEKLQLMYSFNSMILSI